MATRDKAAHGIELGSGAVAGGIGTAFTGQKLRDAYKIDYPDRFHPAAAKMEASAAAHAGARSQQAGRLARTLSHGRADGFVPLAAFTGAAVANRSAKKYRHRRKDKAMRTVSFAKSATTEVAHEAVKAGTRGHVKGIGRVTVMHHHGNGNFMVLDRTDTKRLIHRDRITFAKAAPAPGDSAFGVGHLSKADDEPVTLKVTGQFDSAVRTLKNKALPSTGKLVAVGADKAKQTVQDQARKAKSQVSKDLRSESEIKHAKRTGGSYDPSKLRAGSPQQPRRYSPASPPARPAAAAPKRPASQPRDRHRAARAVEIGSGAGATAAAVSSARGQHAGRALSSQSSDHAVRRDRAFHAARQHAAETDASLGRMTQARTKRHGKGITADVLRGTHRTQAASLKRLQEGVRSHEAAVSTAHQARGVLRRSRTMAGAALGLGAVSVAAHRHADRNRA